ncbi:Gfo/Idh/MocA family oxidoreductase [Intestinicryptomonas porci]|uniref:Gfo/Idh/MocA family oxidoreductase n=1 Tax=Intestinicryptomonas porci TaxID=2926320 RepID=A0ABU4WHR5_9BACT|nr:Gfo/Idh/MocA family oxidoreductase [Opitutales bacterium CLA-KB-P66]
MKNQKKLRCGVIGVGYLGQHHARIYSELEKTELVGIYDASPERAAEIAGKYGCKVFSSIEELASNADALSVAVPTDKHTQVALPLLKSGCHLLIEKPICTSVEDAKKIIEEAKKNDLIVQVGHIEHFNPVMGFMEKNVSNPKFISADRLAPFNIRGTEVGVVLDLMIHDIGIVLKLANSEVESVEAVGVNVLSRTEDIANARIKFKNGCMANLNVSRVSPKKLREIRIFQPGAYMSLDFMNQSGHLVKVENGSIERSEVPFDKQEPLKAELESFADCVINHKMPKVGVNLGSLALEIALEITSQIAPNLQK